jgi:hypothetical protein
MLASLFLLCSLQETELHSFQIPTSGAGVSIHVSGEWFAQFVPSAVPPVRMFRRGGGGWTRTLGLDLFPGLVALDTVVAEAELSPPYLAYGTPQLSEGRGGMVVVEFDEQGDFVSERLHHYPSPDARFGQALASLPDGTFVSGLRGLRHASNRPFIGAVGGISIGRLVGGNYVESQLIVPSDEQVFGGQFLFQNYQLGNTVVLEDDWLVASARAGSFGSVHIYHRDGSGTYSETQIIDPPSPSFNADFGKGLAVEGDLMVIGQPESGSSHGQAHVFRLNESTQQWELGETLRAGNPDTGLAAGDRFGTSVAIDEGRIYVGATNQSTFGVVYLFRPDPTGPFGPFESKYFDSSLTTVSGSLGSQVVAEDGFLMSTDRGAGFGADSRAVYSFSAAVEEDVCGNSGGNNIQLDSWIDSTAGLAPNALRRRGLVLSQVPQDTRFILLGSLTPDTSASGSLFGATGLCLTPPLARMGFGVASSADNLSLLGADDLYPGGDRLLTVIGTVYIQGYCATPAASGLTSSWTNGFRLDVTNW